MQRGRRSGNVRDSVRVRWKGRSWAGSHWMLQRALAREAGVVVVLRSWCVDDELVT